MGGKADTKKKNKFNRIDLTAANNGDAVRAYFYEDKGTGTEVVLIFDIPQAAIKSKMASTGIDLCLESLGTGSLANALFGGGTVSETAQCEVCDRSCSLRLRASASSRCASPRSAP